MKALFFILGILTTIAYTSNDTSFLLVKNKIENSLVMIQVESGDRLSFGSGTLLKIKDQLFTLTNAHVCLSSELDKAIENQPLRKYFRYSITNKHNQIIQFLESHQLKYNVAEDWCLIPTEVSLNYPVLDSSFFSNNIEPSLMYITYNRQKNTSKYDSFKACATNNYFKSKGIQCDLLPEVNSKARSVYATAKDGKPKLMKLKETFAYYLPVIPGDSGSPVFNSKNELVGLVTAAGKLKRIDPELATVSVSYGTITNIKTLKTILLKK